MSLKLDLTGQKYGRLSVMHEVPHYSGKVYWHCRCECGNERDVRACALRTGNTKSCGCLDKESLRTRSITHGLSHTSEHNTWLTIKQRCTNPNNARWDNYGGRGIKLCDRWHDFANFIADMGPRPSPQHSIDRRNNDGDYEPSNCYWATYKQQANNQAPKGTYTALKEARIKEQAAAFWRSRGLEPFKK